MKNDPTRIVDGNRQRCMVCGHPRKEHRENDCSVPKCPCNSYTEGVAKGQAASS